METNNLFIQEQSIAIAAGDTQWKTLLKLKIDPGMKLYVNMITAEISAAGSPEGYFNIILNGKKLVDNYGSYLGLLTYYLWGNHTSFVLTSKDDFAIEVKSNGAATEAEAHIQGLLFPIPKDTQKTSRLS